MSSAMSNEMLETLADALQPIELGAEQRDRMRSRVFQQARDSVPVGTVTTRSAAAEWIRIAPLVEVRELHRDESAGTHTSLMRMQPGAAIPAHRHTKDEDFVILEGECHIGTHLLRAGDVHSAAAGSMHETVTTRTGVLVLLRGEYPYPR
jgi:quercetin dioxygenase-like cupin family protein